MSRPDLAKLSNAEVLAYFSTLEAPTLEEMDGEFARRLLAQPLPLQKEITELFAANPILGRWAGKAFDGGRSGVAGSGTGRGYNYFQQSGDIVRRYPMVTTIAPSRYDGAPAFQLVYRAFDSLCGSVNMVDEVRRVSPGRYLGIGTMGFTRWQRMQPLPFELTGPDAPFFGDLGSLRPDFDLEKALVP